MNSFEKAFAKARKEGREVFEWKGRLYNTRLRGEDRTHWKRYLYRQRLGELAKAKSKGVNAVPVPTKIEEWKNDAPYARMGNNLEPAQSPDRAGTVIPEYEYQGYYPEEILDLIKPEGLSKVLFQKYMEQVGGSPKHEYWQLLKSFQRNNFMDALGIY